MLIKQNVPAQSVPTTSGMVLHVREIILEYAGVDRISLLNMEGYRDFVRNALIWVHFSA